MSGGATFGGELLERAHGDLTAPESGDAFGGCAGRGKNRCWNNRAGGPTSTGGIPLLLRNLLLTRNRAQHPRTYRSWDTPGHWDCVTFRKSSRQRCTRRCPDRSCYNLTRKAETPPIFAAHYQVILGTLSIRPQQPIGESLGLLLLPVQK